MAVVIAPGTDSPPATLLRHETEAMMLLTTLVLALLRARGESDRLAFARGASLLSAGPVLSRWLSRGRSPQPR